ncbi:hypothetical protein E2C01_073804 [Portunus trituberculatus]|uniref:Uncharacterized protein n=1 Tax=Portunus trituberculatus TaxID=210409 RepID=A0A5B7IBJ4_PORTR|nr:hypothetical protein [Portunus trituberculatus]
MIPSSERVHTVTKRLRLAIKRMWFLRLFDEALREQAMTVTECSTPLDEATTQPRHKVTHIHNARTGVSVALWRDNRVASHGGGLSRWL